MKFSNGVEIYDDEKVFKIGVKPVSCLQIILYWLLGDDVGLLPSRLN